MRKFATLFRSYIFGVIASFVIGVALATTLPMFTRAVANWFFPKSHKEITRLTSPDNTVDAVMIETGCAAMCSDGYSVFLVPKGKVPEDESARVVFSADDLEGEKLSWTAPHMLEIAYTKAFINQFANVSYPFAEFGKVDSWHYSVEVRLAPSSTGNSYLKEQDLR